MDITEFKLAELFCGPGWLAYGALQAQATSPDSGVVFKVKPLWANDIDPQTCLTYQKNIHPEDSDAVYCKSVEELDFTEMPSFDALAFGFPCNDFSLVGKQKGFDGKFGPLYSHGIRAINAHNPLWFIAENVTGIRSANSGNAFKKILKDLKHAGKFGYRVTPHLYKFEDYGVPQYRHRIVIVGIRKDLSISFKVPSPTTQNNHIGVLQALTNIPKNIANNEHTRQSDIVIERLKYIPPGKNAWCDELPEHLRLNVKGAKMSQIYKRLSPDKPSYTITGSGGGGTHVYHWKENRALTNRERARIQTFPDSYVFEGSKESVRKQIWMAVPCKGAQVIIEAIMKTFAWVDYDSIQSNIDIDF